MQIPESPPPEATVSRRFSLVEILTVLVIIMILAGLVLGTVGPIKKMVREKKTLSQLHMIEVALEAYMQENGYYPQLGDATVNPQLGSAAVALDDSDADGAGVTIQPMIYSDFWGALEAPVGRKSYIQFAGAGFTPVYVDPTSSVRDDTDHYLDPFGNPFYYDAIDPAAPNNRMMNPEKYDLWSVGYDGEHGVAGKNDDGVGATDDIEDARTHLTDTSDDITNWKSNH